MNELALGRNGTSRNGGGAHSLPPWPCPFSRTAPFTPELIHSTPFTPGKPHSQPHSYSQLSPISCSHPHHSQLIRTPCLHPQVHGWYHRLLLPLLLLEMSGGGLSILGALDAACLCCVCAGVCAAVAMRPSTPYEGKACRRAVTVNLFMGDFVEV
jgi:hypothetical protein